MGEQARQAWEESRAEAEDAIHLFAGKDREQKVLPLFDQTTSVGSLLHKAGLCKPCAWFHHVKGCQRGVRCEFCHCCPPGEIKKRKKEKTVLIRKRRTLQHHVPHAPLMHSAAMADYPRLQTSQYEFPACW